MKLNFETINFAFEALKLGAWEDGRRWPPLESGQHRGGMIKWHQRSHPLFHWTFTISTLFLGQDILWRARSWTPWSFQLQIFYNSMILVHLLCSIYCSLMHTGCLLPMCFNLHYFLWASFCCVHVNKELSVLSVNVLIWKKIKKTLSWVEFIRSPAGWLHFRLLWLHMAGVPTVGATSWNFHHLYCFILNIQAQKQKQLGVVWVFLVLFSWIPIRSSQGLGDQDLTGALL